MVNMMGCLVLMLLVGDVTADSLLALTDESAAAIEAATREGLLELAPVHLPDKTAGDCNHYGWPIATQSGDALVVMHRRIPGHNPKGAGVPDESMSYGIVMRSVDGGKTWSQPYDLRECMRPEDRTRGGLVPLSHRYKFDPQNESLEGYKVHLHAIGTTANGTIIAINNHGVFRSRDAGLSWEHCSKALRDDTFPHPIVNLGPRIIDHPEHGLLAVGNWFEDESRERVNSSRFVVLRSRDLGETWEVEDHPANCRQYEPAAIWHGEELLMVTRDQGDPRNHKHILWKPGHSPVLTDTNLRERFRIDTVDLSFNPVTRRYELLRSERDPMELWLWSLAPEDWASGQWRREVQLLKREGKFYATADGFHPAGAVVDTERGVQHVFIYSGHPNGPVGVFRITRSLDTPRLVAAMKRD